MKVMTNDIRIYESSDSLNNIQTFDESSEGIENKGKALVFNRSFKEAIQHYSKSLEIDSNNHKYLYSRAKVYMVEKDYVNALKDLIESYNIRYEIDEPIYLGKSNI